MTRKFKAYDTQAKEWINPEQVLIDGTGRVFRAVGVVYVPAAGVEITFVKEDDYSIDDMRRAFDAGHTLSDAEWRDKRKLVGFNEFMDNLNTLRQSEKVLNKKI